MNATEKVKSEKPKKTGKAASKKIGAKMAQVAKTASSGNASVKDYGVLLRPVITEKSSGAAGGGSRIVFRVDTRASKDDIRKSVERAFNVKVAAVNTVNYMGKPKRTTRSAGRRASFKKAYVTLAAGQTINVIEGV